MGWIQDILKPVLAKIKQDIGDIDSKVTTIETQIGGSSQVIPYGKFLIYKSDGNTGDTLEAGDIGMGWITPETWIQGCFTGNGSNDLDLDNWNIINQIDKDSSEGVFGPAFSETFN